MNVTQHVSDEFVQFIKSEVAKINSQYPHANLGDAFAHWAGMLALPELDSDEVYNLVVEVSGKGDKGLDLAYRDDINGIHYLFQAKYSNEPKVFGPEAVRELFNAFRYLEAGTKDIDEERLIPISNDLRQSIAQDFEIRFGFLLFGELSESAQLELSTLLSGVDIPGANVIIYDLQELYAQHISLSEIRLDTDDINLDLPLFSESDTCIVASDIEPYSVVANVDLVEYARRIKPYIPRIYDANVRNPLKNKINTEMANTLLDSQRRQYFWHYNNGLTVLVTGIEIVDGILRLSGPTIVNGCQTTATLSKTVEKLGADADGIQLPLLIRFIQVGKDEADTELRLDIARYTNAQSPVLPPDFKSNEDEQATVAHAFQLLTPPVFYERKRGQRNTLSRAEKRKFENIVTMVDVAQRWYAFLISPTYAIINKAHLFQESGTYKRIFNPPRTAAEYYIAYLTFEQFGDLLKERKRISQGKTDEDSLFFLELARSRNLVAAHMTHLVGEIIRRKYGDLDLTTANMVLDRVKKREIVESLQELLIVVISTYNMSLHPDEPLSKEWRKEETIGKLKGILWKQIEVFSKARISILDLV